MALYQTPKLVKVKTPELVKIKLTLTLKYKLEWLNKKLVKVDKYFPSSQLCSECGYRNTDLLLKTKSWICPNCGVKHNRDHNAAVNIKKEGMRMILNPSN